MAGRIRVPGYAGATPLRGCILAQRAGTTDAAAEEHANDLKGTTAAHAVGYYPGSLFGTGPLARAATTIDYGGETVGSGSWPPMGSGSFASAGWQRAAYQRDVYYFPPTGGAQQASLSNAQPSPWCYTVSDLSAAAPWNKYFFFGGPAVTGASDPRSAAVVDPERRAADDVSAGQHP